MEVHILAVQARVLMWVGLAWMAFGLYQGFDPVTVTWRAALAALLAMWMTGKLLKVLVGVMNDRMTADLAARDLPAPPEVRPAAVQASRPVPGRTAPVPPARPTPPAPAAAAAPIPAPSPAAAPAANANTKRPTPAKPEPKPGKP